ncbi:zinc finger protein ZIC 3 isoform X2 [Myiozetetes cayanensis]|uniref:zinc finger protein ZIC 3 isoform X2 n=1 Tax=Myiozetetes cayanensis TaxID=478635 RepID=UPI00215EBDC1|nr:zinc finger protein ZIC 3 isoform X2 [Myiozetetes cayanensis]
MGEKKLFSNKKKYKQTKKFQLCTAFGYNCFSIKSLLFWKEPFLTSSGGRGSRGCRRGPGWRCRRGRAVVFELAMPGEASSSPPRFSPVPLSPPSAARPGSFVPPPRSRAFPSGGRGAPGAAGPPRRGGLDGCGKASPSSGGKGVEWRHLIRETSLAPHRSSKQPERRWKPSLPGKPPCPRWLRRAGRRAEPGAERGALPARALPGGRAGPPRPAPWRARSSGAAGGRRVLLGHPPGSRLPRSGPRQAWKRAGRLGFVTALLGPGEARGAQGWRRMLLSVPETPSQSGGLCCGRGCPFWLRSDFGWFPGPLSRAGVLALLPAPAVASFLWLAALPLPFLLPGIKNSVLAHLASPASSVSPQPWELPIQIELATSAGKNGANC